MGTIAVVGATGTIGSRVVSALAAQGEQVRAIARKPAAAGERVQAHAADLADADAALAALDRASAVYLTPRKAETTRPGWTRRLRQRDRGRRQTGRRARRDAHRCPR